MEASPLGNMIEHGLARQWQLYRAPAREGNDSSHATILLLEDRRGIGMTLLRGRAWLIGRRGGQELSGRG